MGKDEVFSDRCAARSSTGLVRILVALLTFSAALPETAHAQWSGHPFGIGLEVGDPLGFTGKVWLHDRNALQFTLGWHPRYYRESYYSGHYYYSNPGVSIDWVHQFLKFGPTPPTVSFGLHVGVGGAVLFQGGDCYYDMFHSRYCEDLAMVARMPLGFNAYLTKVRFEFFVELVPGFRFFPPVAPTLTAAGGARYYF